MTREEVLALGLKQGDQIRVWFGNFGEQIAEVQGQPMPSGRTYVRKYRQRSETWTGTVSVMPDRIIGPVNGGGVLRGAL